MSEHLACGFETVQRDGVCMSCGHYERVCDSRLPRIKTWKLKDGTVFTHLSKHGFKFSDGTHCDGQLEEVVDLFTIERISGQVYQINGAENIYPVYNTRFIVPDAALECLRALEGDESITLVIAPYLLIDALHKMGVRDEYKKVVAYNATEETRRESPQNKVVDIYNWSY